MEYKSEDINHILYHNRSLDLISNFLPKFDINIILEKEKILTYCRNIFSNDNVLDSEDIIFDKSEFNLDNTQDIIFNKSDIINISLSGNIKESIEYSYLLDRGFTKEIIDKYKLFPMSLIKDKNTLDIIGATTHPILSNILGDGVIGGGVIIPLYDDKNDLINVCIRRLNNSNKLKYSVAIPEIDIWGISNITENSVIWICEGLFDRISMIENGMKNVISASTPGLSIIHLLKIIEKKPSQINIWSDKDRTGLKHSGIIQKFFSINGIPCEVYISEESKDPFDHFYVDNLSINDIYPIKITTGLIDSFPINKNINFLEYLKNRKY